MSGTIARPTRAASADPATRCLGQSSNDKLTEQMRITRDAVKVLNVHRNGHLPYLENGDFGHFPSPSEVAAAEAQVAPALATYDRSLAPCGPDFVVTVVGTLAAAFPAGRGSERQTALKLEIYIDALQDLPADILANAARRAIRRCRYFPTVAELLRAGEDDSVENEHGERIDARNRLARALGEPAVSLPAPANSALLKSNEPIFTAPC